MEQLNISFSPKSDPIGTACGCTFFLLGVKDQVVKLKVEANIVEYKENDDKKNIKIRQLTVSEGSLKSKLIALDLTKSNEIVFKVVQKKLKVKLLEIKDDDEIKVAKHVTLHVEQLA